MLQIAKRAGIATDARLLQRMFFGSFSLNKKAFYITMDEFLAFRNIALQNSNPQNPVSSQRFTGIETTKGSIIDNCTRDKSQDSAQTKPSTYPTTSTAPVISDSEADTSSLRDKLSRALKPEENSTLQKILASEDIEEVSSKLVVYTDGSSRGNGQANSRAGVGVFWGDDDPRNVSERLVGRQTNQRAEITAALRAIQTCGNDKAVLEVRTDSNYVIQSMTSWVHGWLKKGWKGVTNKDLFEELHNAVEKREGEVIWTHIRAHTGVYGNEMADKLANLGASKGLPSGANNKSPS
ncbi:hypothetical protein K7432_011019 [Basidiobolus ranarum]|uniref:ribonuclease H n=1 Tax=Basidiobolus ranarum TaxID=34480 RepID=A0ABR2WMZ3_9FUNG